MVATDEVNTCICASSTADAFETPPRTTVFVPQAVVCLVSQMLSLQSAKHPRSVQTPLTPALQVRPARDPRYPFAQQGESSRHRPISGLLPLHAKGEVHVRDHCHHEAHRR